MAVTFLLSLKVFLQCLLSSVIPNDKSLAKLITFLLMLLYAFFLAFLNISFASLYHSLAITNPQLVYKSLFSFFVLRNDESQAPEDPKLFLSASALQVSLIVWNAHPISLKETLQVLPPPENLNFPKLKCSALRPAPRCCASKSRP